MRRKPGVSSSLEVACWLLPLSMCVSAHGDAAEPYELLEDTAFAGGFGASWNYGRKFTLHPTCREGKATVHREIKSLIVDALKAAKEKQSHLSADPDDYYLFNFTVGWEGLGHWEADGEVSSLSLIATPIGSEEPTGDRTCPVNAQSENDESVALSRERD